jgi:ATP-dependent RNA helicase SUPV3L1/SUV3
MSETQPKKTRRRHHRPRQDHQQEEQNTQSDQPEESASENSAAGISLRAISKRLDLHRATIEHAIATNHLKTITVEDGTQRIPAEEIESVLHNVVHFEQIASTEQIRVQDIADALGIKRTAAKKRLRIAGLDQNKPAWGQLRGMWNLPDTLQGFRTLLREKRQGERIKRREKRAQVQQRKEQKRVEERKRRAELRAQLLASFSVWSEIDRSEQLMMLHVGPPNSGKTYDALLRLADAGEGWYLAPLRLLAWEVAERLNQRGVPCNLLTGEEFIPVEGARITAATIEMFNPANSGAVVVIDEAQMLADPDRGWAWTRAMMLAQAPELHVIAPLTAQTLIQRMAEAANLAFGTIAHERLTPIRVADKPWQLQTIPPRTILVAFSRKMVLTLKTRLEMLGRTVSVVYGSLPPEVRRKQAERFASGETEICVATDAVGMGLNLPADYVCFYEVEKYDGRDIRPLSAAEVHQIGGRAGRYGFSQAGEIGATRRSDLNLLRQLFFQTPPDLTHARVAPTVDDLALIPGSLAEKLREWTRLQSIPQELRSSVRTADMSERIELASKLSDIQVAQLGLANAVQLVNAPTRNSTRDFWYDCATAIIDRYPMPLPPAPPQEVLDTEDLDYTETCISCADVYLWLSQRKEFTEFAEHALAVREERQQWSERIDDALLRKIRMDYLPNQSGRRR